MSECIGCAELDLGIEVIENLQREKEELQAEVERVKAELITFKQDDCFYCKHNSLDQEDSRCDKCKVRTMDEAGTSYWKQKEGES